MTQTLQQQSKFLWKCPEMVLKEEKKRRKGKGHMSSSVGKEVAVSAETTVHWI